MPGSRSGPRLRSRSKRRLGWARKDGGAKLLERLKAKGRYPYCDLDREPVA
jgi:hypothetical protein